MKDTKSPISDFRWLSTTQLEVRISDRWYHVESAVYHKSCWWGMTRASSYCRVLFISLGRHEWQAETFVSTVVAFPWNWGCYCLLRLVWTAKQRSNFMFFVFQCQERRGWCIDFARIRRIIKVTWGKSLNAGFITVARVRNMEARGRLCWEAGEGSSVRYSKLL